MERVNNSRFLGALGFLGFLGFTGFLATENYQHLMKLAFLSLPAVVSLLVLVPSDSSKVKCPVDPKKKPFLLFLFFLGFLAFLGTGTPVLATLACLATPAVLACTATKTA